MKFWLQILFLPALAGCATLDVRVAVLDPVYIKQSVEDSSLKQDAYRLLKGDTSQSTVLALQLKNAYDEALAGTITALETDIDKVNLATTLKAGYRSNLATIKMNSRKAFEEEEVKFFKSIGAENTTALQTLKRIKKIDERISEQREKIAEPVIGKNASYLPKLTPEVRSVLLDRQLTMASYANQVRNKIQDLKLIKDQLAIVNPTEEKTNNEVEKSVQVAVTKGVKAVDSVASSNSIFGGASSLANSAAAYAATSPESKPHWAELYNQAYGSGQLGGTDVAIKMNGTADFTVKGFVFDGRSTAQMVSKIGARAVTLIAAAYGAPFVTAGGSGQTPTTTNFDSSKAIDASVGALASAQAQDAAWRTFMFRIADSIILGADGGDDISTAGTQAVRAAYDSRAATWTAPAEKPK